MRLVPEHLVVPPEPEPRSMVSCMRHRLEVSERCTRVLLDMRRERTAHRKARAEIQRLCNVRRRAHTRRALHSDGEDKRYRYIR